MTTAAMMTLAQAHALLPGSVLVGDGSAPVTRVHSDSRTVQPGDLFLALRGERFDGHDHLPQAIAAGATAFIAERGIGAVARTQEGAQDAGSGDAALAPPAPSSQSLPASGRGGNATPNGLLVPDTQAALQQLATAWRMQFDLPLIAVAGSNGKTTVTQMVASILRAALGDAATLATAGNFNNHIGVPLTLLRLRPQHRAAVLELGMNHAGEMALLAGLAAPTIALVNNAQREHQEFMAGVEAVARENGAVIEALAADGHVVIPADDAQSPLWQQLAGHRKCTTFSLDGQADITAQAQWQADSQQWALTLHTPVGSTATTLHQAGRHNVLNALAATAGALAAGASLAAVAQGIAAFAPVKGRSQLLTLQLQGQAVTLIDDSYNANPDSVLAAIDVLAALPAPRWLLLGDMGEVGEHGPQVHAEVGQRARDVGIDTVWAAGALCAHAGADRHFGTVAALLEALCTSMPPAASVLVKGSRFMQMEQVVQALQALQPGAAHVA